MHTTALSVAWANTYARTFTCQACSSNSVPFLPGSNLVAAYDGASWSIRCEKTTSSKTLLDQPVIGSMDTLTGPLTSQQPGSTSLSTGAASGQDAVVLEAGVPLQQAAPAGAGTADPAAPTTVAAGAAGTAAVTAGAAAADSAASASAVEAAHSRGRRDQSWYKRGRRRRSGGSSSSSSSSGGGGGGGNYVVAPWWPGQCVDCSVVGSTADPTNTYCSKCAGTQLCGRWTQQQGLTAPAAGYLLLLCLGGVTHTCSRIGSCG